MAVPAAYAFSRFRFPGRTFLFFAVLLRNMFPAVVFLMPLFILMRWLGLVGTHASLVLTYLTFGLPLSIWLLKGFYDNIPIQLEQAARIDGATRFQAFFLIVMPLSTPGIIATSIFSFIGAWNEYVYAVTFLNKKEQLTLPVGIQRFFAEFATDWPGLMAATFLMSGAGRGAVPGPADATSSARSPRAPSSTEPVSRRSPDGPGGASRTWSRPTAPSTRSTTCRSPSRTASSSPWSGPRAAARPRR